MKKLYISASLLMSVAALASAQSKFDGTAQRLVNDNREMANTERTDMPRARSLSPAEVNGRYLVTLNEGYSADDITAAGFEVVHVGSEVIIVESEVSRLEDLAALDAVRHIAASRRMKPFNDRGRQLISANAVHDGTGTGLNGHSFTGKGVVTGIIDLGIDPNHITFFDEDGVNRVKRFYTWSGYYASRQTAYTTPDAVARATTGHTDYDHGTHTMGTMSGSYKGKGVFNYAARDISLTDRYTEDNPGDIPYYGVATGSDIVATDCDLFDDRVIQGIENAVEYAEANDMPCVINFSLGSTYGPRDASTPLNKLFSDYKDRAILVFATGNQGGDKIAVRGEFDDNTKQIRTIVVSPFTSGNVTYEGEFWSSDNTIFTLSPCIVDITTGEVKAQYDFDTNTHGSPVWFNGTQFKKETNPNYNPDEWVDKAFRRDANVKMVSNIDTGNDRYNVQIYANMMRNASSDKNLMFGYLISAPAGTRVYGYINSADRNQGLPDASFGSMNLDGWTDGTNDGSISDMACADGVIAVGSYTYRLRWYNLDASRCSLSGFYDTKGQVSSFSSYARLNDGRALPHVIAPGAAIISATNKYYVEANKMTVGDKAANVVANGRDNLYEAYAGTSMATPFVSGTIALMLEAYPEMSVDEAIKILQETASTEDIKNLSKTDAASYGAGLINTEKAVAAAIKASNSVSAVTADPDRQFMLMNEGRVFTAVVGGAAHLNATLYNIAGSAVAHAAADGETVTLDASGLNPGVYIIRVSAPNATYTRRVIVR